jgi:cysteinyl-tRNA synthetase
MRNLLAAIAVMAIVTVLISGCIDVVPSPNPPKGRDYRQDMRSFVQGISGYAKRIKPNFIIIPQNGHELLTEDGEPNGSLSRSYLEAIDGMGREDLLYGYTDDDLATPLSEREYMVSFMDVAENNDIEVLVTDYCSTGPFVDDSYSQNAERSYISFAAAHRELDNIPEYPANPYNTNSSNVTSLTEARNFLYLINSGAFPDKDAFLHAIRETDYDIVIMDLFCDGVPLRGSEVESLRIKANGGSRLVLAYMSIGEAEDYRYYWQREWETTPPSWLAEENPEWPGNYEVRYWDKDWQNIIYGKEDSFLKSILDAGFDGAYLDIVDAFEYFEDQ